ncbi:MAG TPA: HemK family protein methyltransferase, partial [Flavisolibacter sp.]|nr:HemK family protein methyltransferase [Flavisolibacter sp.]
MKPAEAQKALSEALISIYDKEEAEAIAELALEALTGYERKDLRTTYRDFILDPEQEKKLDSYKERLLLHEPIQYVTGKAWFYGMELYVDPSVLIPRPETEELVDWIVKDLKAAYPDYTYRAAFEADKTSHLKILDIGTGSGCIALGIKKAIPVAEVWGCDCSEAALAIARRNSATLDIRVDFQGV